MVMVASASAAVSVGRYGTPYHFLLRHLLYAGLGVLALFAFSSLDYRRLARPSVVFGFLGLTAGLLVAALLSPGINGVNRWVLLGPLSFQPSEAAKLALVLFLAWLLHKREGRTNDFSATLLPALVVLGQLVLLVALEPDLGAAGMLMLLFVSIFFLAGVSWAYITGCAGVFLVTLTIYALSAEYRVVRLVSFLDPQADPLGSGFQVNQALIAVGSGGLAGVSHAGPLGTGLGESLQKLFFLPYPHTDFIFAVVGEELGLAGGLVVVALFTVLLWRGMRIALRAPDRFGALLAGGLTMAVVAQAYLNMGVVLGLVPTKGFPLPLISYGGSSLVCTCVALGVVLSVSSATERKS
jgi:cell division protein FtsW